MTQTLVRTLPLVRYWQPIMKDDERLSDFYLVPSLLDSSLNQSLSASLLLLTYYVDKTSQSISQTHKLGSPVWPGLLDDYQESKLREDSPLSNSCTLLWVWWPTGLHLWVRHWFVREEWKQESFLLPRPPFFHSASLASGMERIVKYLLRAFRIAYPAGPHA